MQRAELFHGAVNKARGCFGIFEIHDRGDASALGRSHLRHLLVQATFIPANKQNGRASRSEGAHSRRPDAGTCSGDDHRLARESPVKAGFCTYARQPVFPRFSQPGCDSREYGEATTGGRQRQP